MMQRRRDGDTLVYGTDMAPAHPSPPPVPTAGHDTVRIWLEKKGRNGTPVSIIRGFPGGRDALAALASRLKRACGTGGSAKNGEVIIQGDHRERIAALLERDGLRVKLAGG